MIIHYLDVSYEDILIGIDSDTPEVILEVVTDFFGTDFEPTNNSPFEDVGSFHQNTVIVKSNLADEAFLMLMLENDISVYVTN
jgi:hypothetical protein